MSGATNIHFEIASNGGLVDVSEVTFKDPARAVGEDSCRGSLTTPVTLKLSTDDGALDETLPAVLEVRDDRSVFLAAPLDPAAIHGGFRLVETPHPDLIKLEVVLRWNGDRLSGFLGGSVPLATEGRAKSTAGSGTGFAALVWPAAEN